LRSDREVPPAQSHSVRALDLEYVETQTAHEQVGLRLLLGHGFSGPISVHVEYEPRGASHEEAVLETARKDLAFLKARIAEAGGVPAPA